MLMIVVFYWVFGGGTNVTPSGKERFHSYTAILFFFFLQNIIFNTQDYKGVLF